MERSVLVFGHRSPDTDTICSAIAASKLLGGTPGRLGELNEETEFVLRKFGFKALDIVGNVAGKAVFLIDHNEQAQSAEGIGEAKIVGIIDHHKLNLKTAEPIFMRVEPIGSTATVIYKMYLEAGKKPDKKLAGILLAALLSDTIIFRSTTCTPEDKRIAKELGKIAGVKKIEAFGFELMGKKASLAGKDLRKKLSSDMKIFPGPLGTYALIGLEILDEKEVEKRLPEILGILGEMKESGRHHSVVLVSTNITDRYSDVYVKTDHLERLESSFGKKFDSIGKLHLPRAMSKKKDVVPFLEKAFA